MTRSRLLLPEVEWKRTGSTRRAVEREDSDEAFRIGAFARPAEVRHEQGASMLYPPPR
jgi:hypothetical protein